MKPVVTEQTSKRYKGLMLIGALIACIGMVVAIGRESSAPGVLTIFAGLIVYLYARFAAWWNHG